MSSSTSNITPFIYNGQDVRVVLIDDEVWFVAKDICDVLEIRSDNIPSILDEDEYSKVDPYTIGVKTNAPHGMTMVSEAGLYSLVLKSRKPEAKAFKRKVTHEILPSIRRHGMYATDATIEKVLTDPDFGIKLLTELKTEREARLQAESEKNILEVRIETDRPKVLFADAVATAKTSILVGDFAKLVKQNGVNIGQKRLFSLLRENGFLMCQKGSSWNMPTQRSMELGLFEIKETAITHSDGHIAISRTVKVTGKGQIYLMEWVMKHLNQQVFG